MQIFKSVLMRISFVSENESVRESINTGCNYFYNPVNYFSIIFI